MKAKVIENENLITITARVTTGREVRAIIVKGTNGLWLKPQITWPTCTELSDRTFTFTHKVACAITAVLIKTEQVWVKIARSKRQKRI